MHPWAPPAGHPPVPLSCDGRVRQPCTPTDELLPCVMLCHPCLCTDMAQSPPGVRRADNFGHTPEHSLAADARAGPRRDRGGWLCAPSSVEAARWARDHRPFSEPTARPSPASQWLGRRIGPHLWPLQCRTRPLVGAEGGGGGWGEAPKMVCHIQHSPNTPTTGLRERRNDTSKSTGRSGRQNAATRRNMRREERVTVQGPVKEQQPDGMSHRGLGRGPQNGLRSSNRPPIFGLLRMPPGTSPTPTPCSTLCAGGCHDNPDLNASPQKETFGRV